MDHYIFRHNHHYHSLYVPIHFRQSDQCVDSDHCTGRHFVWHIYVVDLNFAQIYYVNIDNAVIHLLSPIYGRNKSKEWMMRNLILRNSTHFPISLKLPYVRFFYIGSGEFLGVIRLQFMLLSLIGKLWTIGKLCTRTIPNDQSSVSRETRPFLWPRRKKNREKRDREEFNWNVCLLNGTSLYIRRNDNLHHNPNWKLTSLHLTWAESDFNAVHRNRWYGVCMCVLDVSTVWYMGKYAIQRCCCCSWVRENFWKKIEIVLSSFLL